MTAIDLNSFKPDLDLRRRRLEDRLSAFARQVRTRALIAGAARIIAELALFAIVSFLLDRWLRLSLPMRLMALLLAIFLIGWQAWKYLILPLRGKLAPIDLAAALDRRNGKSPLLAPRVATVLELPQLLDRPYAPSPAMVRKAVEHADDSLQNVQFAERLDQRKLRQHLGAIGIAVLIACVLIAASPSLAALWARRWFGGSNQPWPQRTYLEVAGLHDGRILVPRGEPFVLRTSVRDKSVEPQSVSIRLRDARGGGKVNASMTRFAPGDFRYDLPSVESATQVEIEGGDEYLEPFVIEPVDRPRIAKLELTSQHPTEKAPQVHGFAGQEADLSFLPQTKLKLRFDANAPIADAKIKGPYAPRRLDDRRFEIEWTHTHSVQMEIELIGAQANLSSLPTRVTIGLKIDQPPRVSLSYSGVRQRIAPMAKIPMTILARDDYGIASIDIAARVESLDADKKLQAVATTQTLMPATAPSETEIQLKHTFEVAALKIAPGALLSISGRASDACYGGAQVGTSKAATFRIVAANELFKEILLRQQGERAKFRKAIDAAKKVRGQLAAQSSTESASQSARDHRTIHREVQRITTSLTESLTELKLNGLGSPEACDLMDKNILKPLGALSEELMIPQRDALDAISANPSDRSKLDAAIARQDQIVARMEEVLKQMAQWDSFVDVLNQLNEIIRMQEKVKSGTDELKGKEADSVFDK